MIRYLGTRGRSIQLSTEISRGGEGIVYAIDGDSGVVAKIYKTGKARDREKKVVAMVEQQLAVRSPLIAFPHEALYDKHGGFADLCIGRMKTPTRFLNIIYLHVDDQLFQMLIIGFCCVWP